MEPVNHSSLPLVNCHFHFIVFNQLFINYKLIISSDDEAPMGNSIAASRGASLNTAGLYQRFIVGVVLLCQYDLIIFVVSRGCYKTDGSTVGDAMGCELYTEGGKRYRRCICSDGDLCNSSSSMNCQLISLSIFVMTLKFTTHHL